MIISNINRKYCLINVTSSSRCSTRSWSGTGESGGIDGRRERDRTRERGWAGSLRHLDR